MGQSQRPGTVPDIWDSPKVLGLSQAFGSLRLRNNPHGVGTLGLWDSPKGPGLSRASGTVPGFWVSESKYFKKNQNSHMRDSGSLGQSQRTGTVTGFCDNPKVPGLSQASGTTPKSRDCPRLLGLCQRPRDPGTVLGFWDYDVFLKAWAYP